MGSETSETNQDSTTIDQSDQTVEGHQVNIGGDARIGHVGDKISGQVVITGQVDGDVHITTVQRAPVAPPPPPVQPPAADFFVGREAELALYAATLDQVGIAVISGMAGMGKTTLASVLARRTARPEKIFWHSFHEGEGIDGLVWRLAGFLATNGEEAIWELLQNALQSSSTPPPPEMLFDFLVEQVRHHNYLLCLDDFQFVDSNPLLNQLVERIRPLLVAGDMKLIITSREVPEFVQLATFTALEGLGTADLGQMLAAGDIYLEEEQIAQLHQYTGGNAQMLTLAIDLLQSGYEAQELLTQLVETDDLEDFLMDEVESRLTRNERLAMSAVAVLQGYPGSRAAVEAVLDGRRLRRVLRDLSHRFLLIVSRGDEGRNYNQHAIVRDFFYEALNQRERRRMHLRAAEFYRDEEQDSLLAARHYYEAADFVESVGLLTADVRAIINKGQARQTGHLLDSFQRDQLDRDRWIAVKLAGGRVHAYFGENQQARERYELALAEIEQLPQSGKTHPSYVDLCYAMGDLLRQEDPREALDWFEHGRTAAGESSAEQQAALDIGEGVVYTFLEQFAEAKPLLEEGLALLDPQPSQLRITAIGTLGVVYAEHLGDLETAVVMTREALALSEQLGDQFRQAELLSTLGTYRFDANDRPGAMADFEEARRLARHLGNNRILAMTEANLGHATMISGDYETAERHISAGLDLFRRTNEQVFACQAMLNLSELYLQQRKWSAAAAMLSEVEPLARQLGADYHFPEIYMMRAEYALETGDLETARAMGRQALDSARELDSPFDSGLVLQVWGRILSASGQLAESEAAFAESVELLQEVDALSAARSKAAWGLVLMTNGDSEPGDLLLAEARATFESLGANGDLATLDEGSGQ